MHGARKTYRKRGRKKEYIGIGVKISIILRHWKKRNRCDGFADARPSRPTPPFLDNMWSKPVADHSEAEFLVTVYRHTREEEKSGKSGLVGSRGPALLNEE